MHPPSPPHLPLAACALAALLAAPLPAQDRPSDWPQFRGPGGRATSPDKGLPSKWTADDNVAWKAELPGPGTSSPIIIGSRLFLTCYKGYRPNQRDGDQKNLRLLLVCLGRDKGNVLWTREVTPRLPEQDRIRDDHGYASSTPAADAERVYAFFGKTGVFAFDHAGKQLWHTEVGSELSGWGSAASPVLHGDLVIVNASVESQCVIALNKKTGKEVWRAEGIKESWNTPVIGAPAKGGPELIVAMLGKVLGLDPATGKELWSCKTDIPWYMVPSLSVHDGVAYCVGGRSGGGLAVRLGGRGDVTRSHRLWTIKKGSNVSSPIYHDGHLYWMHEMLGVAYCADAKTGKIVYEEELPRAGQVYSSPALADGKIFYVAREGRTFVVAAKPKFELLATNTVEPRGTFNASPAVAGKKLFLRSEKFLYCIGQK